MHALRVVFRKLTDERHALEIQSDDGREERVECETRSLLVHDFLHYAVEAEARLDIGFYGALARGRSLASMNDRTLPPDADPALATIERLVGALHPATKGREAHEVVSGVVRFTDALGEKLPWWVSVDVVEGAQERMRRIIGEWNATPRGGTIELPWPAPAKG